MKAILRSTALSSMFLPAMLSLVACQGASRTPRPTPDMAEVAGTYALVSVDANPLPATVNHGGTALEVRSGSFTIGADGRCSSTTVFLPPSGRETVREVHAVFAKDGATLTMWWEGAGTTTGAVDGNTFTLHNEGLLFLYRR